MKKLIFALLLLPFILNGQESLDSYKKKKKNSDSAIHVKLSENYPMEGMVFNAPQKWNYKRTIIGCGVAFIGGVANGYHETILNHYP